MAARTLDGVAIANQIRAEVAPGVAAFTAKTRRPPGLGIVLVGENPAWAYARRRARIWPSGRGAVMLRSRPSLEPPTPRMTA